MAREKKRKLSDFNLESARWNDDEEKTLEEHVTYYRQMAKIVRSIKEKGQFDGRSLPSKPKSDLMTLLGRVSKQKKKKKVLVRKELDEYLREYINEDNEDLPQSFSQLSHEADSLETLTVKLKAGYEALMLVRKRLLWRSIEYGELLNVCAERHKRQKIQGTMELTWKQWLRKYVDISDSYARQLRELSSVLISYPKFRHVTLPFLEMYQRRKQIEEMLKTNTEIASFWREQHAVEM